MKRNKEANNIEQKYKNKNQEYSVSLPQVFSTHSQPGQCVMCYIYLCQGHYYSLCKNLIPM